MDGPHADRRACRAPPPPWRWRRGPGCSPGWTTCEEENACLGHGREHQEFAGLARTGWALAAASSWRAKGWPRLLPVNVTVSTNFRCNFKCVTCNVYERKVNELDADEWGASSRRSARPRVVHLQRRRAVPAQGPARHHPRRPRATASPRSSTSPPTGGSPTGRGRRREDLQGQPGDAARDQPVVRPPRARAPRRDPRRAARGTGCMKTLAGLRALELPNLTVGCHTVVSKENEHDFPDIAQGLAALGPTPTSPSRPRSGSSSRRSGWASRPRQRTSRPPPPPCSRTRSRRTARWPAWCGHCGSSTTTASRASSTATHRDAGVPRRVPVDPHRRRRRRVVVLRAVALVRQPARRRLRLQAGVVLARGRGVPHLDARPALRLPAGQRHVHEPARGAGGHVAAWPPTWCATPACPHPA